MKELVAVIRKMNRPLSIACCTLSLLACSLFSAFAANHNAALGKVIYEANCASCHKDGIMGAPKTGNKPSWTHRLEQGMDVLVSKSIKGYQGKKGLMPAKGGNTKLTDAEVGNAVAHMVSLCK